MMFDNHMFLGSYWVILFISVLDLTLTHYSFFLLKKCKEFNINDEKGLLIKVLMFNNPAPWNYVLQCLLVSVFAIYAFMMIAGNWFFVVTLIWFGAYSMITVTHYYNIVNIRRRYFI